MFEVFGHCDIAITRNLVLSYQIPIWILLVKGTQTYTSISHINKSHGFIAQWKRKTSIMFVLNFTLKCSVIIFQQICKFYKFLILLSARTFLHSYQWQRLYTGVLIHFNFIFHTKINLWKVFRWKFVSIQILLDLCPSD